MATVSTTTLKGTCRPMSDAPRRAPLMPLDEALLDAHIGLDAVPLLPTAPKGAGL